MDQKKEIIEICKAASLNKGLYSSVRDGIFGSLDLKRSEGINITLSEVLKSIFNTLQIQGVTDCTMTIAAMYAMLNEIDKKFETNYQSQVPGFAWREGYFCYPAMILERMQDLDRRWACTPQERKRCGLDDECMRMANELHQQIEWVHTDYIPTVEGPVIPVRWNGMLSTINEKVGQES